MRDINIGDTVRFLNYVGGGKVTGFRQGGIVLVEDEDGFETPVLQNEVVVVEPPEPQQVKILVTEHSTGSATLHKHATVKTEKPVGTAPKTESPKVANELVSEETEDVETRILRLEMTVKKLQMRIERLEAAKTIREHVKQRELEERDSKQSQKDTVIEIDLHAEKLLETTTGMSAHDIKEYQLDVFRHTMEEHKNKKGRKIVFIHGNGDGVLRKAIISELRHTYKRCEYQDASFLQYGFGATMVTIH